MKIRFASALLALALPVLAQDPAAAQAENMFYKAFWLEKGPRDFAGAMSLYEQFLAKAPEHALAKEAAKQQFNLLHKTGKTKEAEAFAQKHEKLLGKNPVAAVSGDAEPAAPRGEGRAPDAAGGAGAAPGRPGRGEGARGEGAPGAGGMRGNPQERLAELEKQLAQAKEEGNEEAVRRLSAQIERIKAMGEGRGAGAGGPGAGRGEGPGAAGGRRGGMGGGMFGTKKLTEMTPDELTQFKDGVGRMEGLIERMGERLGEEQRKALETNLDALKKSLDANKLDDAQKALDKIREAMPMGGRRGGGGGGN